MTNFPISVYFLLNLKKVDVCFKKKKMKFCKETLKITSYIVQNQELAVSSIASVVKPFTSSYILMNFMKSKCNEICIRLCFMKQSERNISQCNLALCNTVSKRLNMQVWFSKVLFILKNLSFELKIQIITTGLYSKSQTMKMKDVAVTRV